MTTTHRITTGIVAAVALAASAAPASARPVDLNTNGSYVPTGAASMQGHRQSAGVSCGDVCSGHGYSATSTPAHGTVDHRPGHPARQRL